MACGFQLQGIILLYIIRGIVMSLLKHALIILVVFTCLGGCVSTKPGNTLHAINGTDYLIALAELQYDSHDQQHGVDYFRRFAGWCNQKYSSRGQDMTDRTKAIAGMLRVLDEHAVINNSGRVLFIEQITEDCFSGGYGYQSYAIIYISEDDQWKDEVLDNAGANVILVNQAAWDQAEKLTRQAESNKNKNWPASPLIVHLWDGSRWHSSIHNDPGFSWMADKGAFADTHGELTRANRAWSSHHTQAFDLSTLLLYVYLVSGLDNDAAFGPVPDGIAARLMGDNEFILGQMGKGFPGGVEEAIELLDKHAPSLPSVFEETTPEN